MNDLSSLKRYLSLTIFFTFDLILLGAGVRALNAGLACPDWPLCFGKIVPDVHLGVWMEFIHRAIAGLVSICFAIVIFMVFKKTRKGDGLRTLCIFGLLILASQVMMGALTVLKLLVSGIVTTHLALAIIFLGTLIVMKKRVGDHDQVFSQNGRLPFIFVVPLIAIFGQIILGGWVATTYSGQVCIDFPTCAGEWIPTLQGPLGIQVIHRFGAYLTALVFIVFAFKIFKSPEPAYRNYRVVGHLMIWGVLGQILLGILNLKLALPVWLTVMHLAGAVLLFRLALELAYGVLRPEKA